MPDDDANACADRLKVLADPTRLAVMNRLMSGPKRVSELHETMDVDQSLLSHHLRVLRDCGLVLSRREGKGVRYELASGVRADDPSPALDLGCCRLSFPSEDS